MVMPYETDEHDLSDMAASAALTSPGAVCPAIVMSFFTTMRLSMLMTPPTAKTTIWERFQSRT